MPRRLSNSMGTAANQGKNGPATTCRRCGNWEEFTNGGSFRVYTLEQSCQTTQGVYSLWLPNPVAQVAGSGLGQDEVLFRLLPESCCSHGSNLTRGAGGRSWSPRRHCTSCYARQGCIAIL